MTSVLPPHPLRLLCLSAIAGVSLSCLMLFAVVKSWNIQHAEPVPTLTAHSDVAWERERLKAIEKSPRIVVPRAPDAPPPSSDATVVRTLDSLRRRIEERYDIEILMFDAGFLQEEGIDAHPYPLSSLQEHLRSLNDWIRIYPREYINHTGLKTIALFKGWEQNGVPTAGFLLDRSTIGIEAKEAVFHHELFHVADMNDGGMESDNADWLRGKYGKHIPKQPPSDSLHAISQKLHEGQRPAGFVNAYGKYGGIDEDQASVAEYLLSYPEQVRTWTKNDSVLSKSVHAIQVFLYAHSDGLMDESFWVDQQKKVRLDDGYWETHRSSMATPSPELASELYRASKLEEARAIIAKGKPADAEVIFLELIAATPDRTSIVSELGALYEEKKEYAKAIDLYQRTLSPANDPYFDLKIARNLKSLGKTEDAITHYTNANQLGYLIDVEKEDFEALYEQHATALARSGNHKEAESAYRLMLRIFGERKEWRDAIAAQNALR